MTAILTALSVIISNVNFWSPSFPSLEEIVYLNLVQPLLATFAHFPKPSFPQQTPLSTHGTMSRVEMTPQRNHRIVRAEGDLQSKPPFKQGHLEQITQVGWNVFREGDSMTSPGRLFQCSAILNGKKFFLILR